MFGKNLFISVFVIKHVGTIKSDRVFSFHVLRSKNHKKGGTMWFSYIKIEINPKKMKERWAKSLI
jgi:hypothetical protein